MKKEVKKIKEEKTLRSNIKVYRVIIGLCLFIAVYGMFKSDWNLVIEMITFALIFLVMFLVARYLFPKWYLKNVSVGNT